MPSPLAKKVARALTKAHGKGAAAIASKAQRRGPVGWLPVGIEPIDRYVLGGRGLPLGRISEVYAPEGAGKTSWLYQCLAAAQRAGGIGVMADTEDSYDEERAAIFGVDLDDLVMVENPKDSNRPPAMEHVLDAAVTTIGTLEPDDGPVLFGWDSVAASATLEELKLKTSFEKNARVGTQAQLMSRAIRTLNSIVSNRQAHLMCVNQIRHKIGVAFGDNTTTPGGNALKFYASVRLQILGGKAFKIGDAHVAKDLTVMAYKNRHAPPFRRCRVRLNYEKGWDTEWTTVEFAKSLGLVADHKASLEDAERALGWRDDEA